MTTALRETTFTELTGDLDEMSTLDELFGPVAAPAAQAACLDEDPELFFAEAPSDLELAKMVCRECPIREQCLAGALRRREPHGVWGGEIFADGQVIARKRPRGRPRKHPVPDQQLAA